MEKEQVITFDNLKIFCAIDLCTSKQFIISLPIYSKFSD